MRNDRQIVQPISSRQKLQFTIPPLQSEIRVEPRDMAKLPDQRIDDIEPRPNALLRSEIAHQLQRAGAASRR